MAPEFTKVLPVDVKEANGILTRGYVQDVLEDGHLLVHFDELPPKPPIRIASKNAFRVTSASACWYHHRSKNDPWTGSGSRSEFKNGGRVRLLLRAGPDGPLRWYPGQVLGMDFFPLVEVTMPGGDIRMIMAESCEPSEVVRHDEVKDGYPRFVPFPAVLCKFQVQVPPEQLRDLQDANFTKDWECQTNTVVLSLESDRGVLSVLSFEDNPLCPVGHLRSIERRRQRMLEAALKEKLELESIVDGSDGDSEPEEPPGKKKIITDRGELFRLSATGTVTAATNAEIIAPPDIVPDVLVKIFRLIDVEDRLRLKRVCKMWRDLMELPSVLAVARFRDIQYESPGWGGGGYYDGSEPKLTKCRLLSSSVTAHLETMIFIYGDSKSSESLLAVNPPAENSFLCALSVVRHALPPQLKRIIFHGGRVYEGLLADLLSSTPAMISLYSVRVEEMHYVELDNYELEEWDSSNFHVFVEAADLRLDALRFEEDPVKRYELAKAVRPDGLTRMRKLYDSALEPYPVGDEERTAITAEIREYPRQERHAFVDIIRKCVRLNDPSLAYSAQSRLESLRIGALYFVKALITGEDYRCPSKCCASKGKAEGHKTGIVD